MFSFSQASDSGNGVLELKSKLSLQMNMSTLVPDIPNRIFCNMIFP
jgi:hypothetical protein